MAFTKAATNFNGGLSDFLYKVLGVGNEVISKQGAYLETRVRSKKELGRLSATADPVRAYVKTPVLTTNETQTTTYNKRDLTMNDVMIFEQFTPNDFYSFWERWGSSPEFTQMQLSPALLAEIMDLTMNNAGTHLSKLYFQGDTGSGDATINTMDGIIKLALADSDVIDVATLGAITTANVFNVLADFWEAIPNKFYDNPAFKIMMSTTDYKTLQRANTDSKKTTVGVLDAIDGMSYQGKPIVHFSGIPSGTIIGAEAGAFEGSNLVFGMWYSQDEEFRSVNFGRVENYSDEYFLKINMKLGAQYRYGGDIVLYRPA